METDNVQELVESALEEAIESLDLIATDDHLNNRLRHAQAACNRALVELRGYGHQPKPEEWQKN